MKYTYKDLGSFGLHLINTDKFKTITTRVVFHTPIKKKEITKRNLISDILLQSSKKYETKRDMTIQAEELYAADISTNNQRLGNYIFTSFSLQVLQDKYTEENNLANSLEFLSEIIFNPDITNDSFQEDKLSIVKHNAEVSINSLKEDAANYSLIRMNEAFNNESPTSYRMVGYLEDLEKISKEKLYQAYLEMLDNDFVDIFVVGEFDNNEMLSLIKKHFQFKKIKKPKETYYLESRKARRRRLIAKETIDNNQSRLAIACPVNKLTDYERNYSLPLANVILGGGPDSKLFQEVREKNSLCYTINSSYNSLDSLLVITAGIDKKNYQQALDLITLNLQKMKKGNLNSTEINEAKEFFQTYAEEVEESPTRMMNEILLQAIFKKEPITERLAKIQKVRKQDILKAIKKVNMDTIFLLEGVMDENN